MNLLVYKIRERIKSVVKRYSWIMGQELMGVETFTTRYSSSYLIPAADKISIEIPDATLMDASCTAAPELAGGRVEYDATGVYQLPGKDFPGIKILSNGAILLGKKLILATGLSPEAGSKVAALTPDLRRHRTEKYIIAPFPHSWGLGTYGDFLVRVLPRICRIVEKMAPEHRRDAVIAYPLFHGSYEKTILGMLGFSPEQLIDTRKVRVDSGKDGIIYCATGESGNWGPQSAHPGDYQAVRRLIGVKALQPVKNGRRFYLQRVGRRCILNEADILPLLAEHGFETVDLGKFPIAEQIKMCGEASVMLGVQGASLTNMLWCAPGATIVELFGRGFRPAILRHMAYNLDLQYRYWAELPMSGNDFAKVHWDSICDVPMLKKYLEREWGTPATS